MADQKITDLTADTSPSSDDLIVIVDDPGGSPVNKKVTLANLYAAIKTLTNTTIDADGTGNSISNIENADIKSAAAIAVNKLAALTASRAVVTDGSGFISAATTTATEIGYVNGVTSAIQTQLGTKLTGPASTTDNAIVRVNGTGGYDVQGYTSGDPTISDVGEMALSNKLTITGTAGASITLGNSVTDQPNSISVNSTDAFYVYGLAVSAINTNASANSGVIGLSFSARSTQTLNSTRNVYGLNGQTSLVTSGVTQNSHYGIVGYGTGFISSGSSTISNFYGIFGSPFTVLGGSITVTRNYAAGFDGDIAMIANKLQWTTAHGTAPDTNLYRSAADTLKTDDSFIAGAGLTIASLGGYLFGTAGVVSAKSAATVTSELSDFVGDSGSGGTKGLVPAPSAGDSGKYLKGDGTWATLAGGGNVSNTGTPANNQIAVWTDATTIEGDSALTFDTSSDTLSVGTSGIVVAGSIELGHASDTTISRVSSGQIAVEGVNVLMNGGALGTPSSGTLTNCSGLPLSGVVDSTSEALGVGSLELGHASDTTITRVSAGVAAIEGNNIITANNLTNLKKRQLEFIIGDGTNVISTGAKPTAVVSAPCDGTITGWTILSCDAASPTSGSITLDIWKDTYANYAPTVLDTITASAKPSVTTATKNTSTTLTGWTTSITAGDILFVNVDSVTSFKCVKLIIHYNAT